MTQIDQIIADALAGSPETHVAILAREVVRLRGEAPAVAVPEWDEGAFFFAHATPPNPSIEYSAAMRAAKAGYAFAISRARAIPADRVLGEGMVQVSERELACMRAELEYRRAESDEAPDSVLDPLWDAFDALRANQGGADHD